MSDLSSHDKELADVANVFLGPFFRRYPAGDALKIIAAGLVFASGMHSDEWDQAMKKVEPAVQEFVDVLVVERFDSVEVLAVLTLFLLHFSTSLQEADLILEDRRAAG